jgi:hypothetical protein
MVFLADIAYGMERGHVECLSVRVGASKQVGIGLRLAAAIRGVVGRRREFETELAMMER